jgi:hypothetical protein
MLQTSPDLRPAHLCEFKHLADGAGSDTAVREVVMARDADDDFRAIASGRRSALSFIAVASDLPSAVQANGTVFIDEGNELLVDKESTIRELTENKAYQAAALKCSQSRLPNGERVSRLCRKRSRGTRARLIR